MKIKKMFIKSLYTCYRESFPLIQENIGGALVYVCDWDLFTGRIVVTEPGAFVSLAVGHVVPSAQDTRVTHHGIHVVP